MLGKAFRPWRQLPDLSFAGVTASLCVTCNWGDLGGVFARRVPDTLLAPSAQRSVSAYFALGASAINAVAFFLRCAVALSKLVGDGALDVPQTIAV